MDLENSWSPRGIGTQGRKMWGLSSLLLSFPNESCSAWSRQWVNISVASSSLWNCVVTQFCLRETGVHFWKPPTLSAALVTKTISDGVVGIWVDSRKASLGEVKQKQPTLPLEIKFSSVPGVHIAFLLGAQQWTGHCRGDRERRQCLP